MFKLSRKKQPILGIDISSTAVKVLQLSSTANGYCVDHIGITPLPDDCISEKIITDVEAVAACIKSAVQQSRSKAKHCIMAIAGSNVVSKVITMPKGLSDAELEAQISVEADQHIPHPLNEVNLDFNVLATNDKQADKVDVLLAASKTENITTRVTAAELAGLQPIIIDVEAYSVETIYPLLAHQIPGGGDNKTIGILDIGATITSLNIMRDGKTIYTREQDFGGSQLTAQIMHEYNLSYAEAGYAKKHHELPADYESKLLTPFKQTAAQQCNRFLQFFYSASQHTSVDHIILAGGCALIPGLDQTIQDELQIPVTGIGPLQKITFNSTLDEELLEREYSSLLLAFSLALRAFE